MMTNDRQRQEERAETARDYGRFYVHEYRLEPSDTPSFQIVDRLTLRVIPLETRDRDKAALFAAALNLQSEGSAPVRTTRPSWDHAYDLIETTSAETLEQVLRRRSDDGWQGYAASAQRQGDFYILLWWRRPRA